MDADTEQLIREMWADLGAGQRRASSEIRAELGAFRTEIRSELEAFRTEIRSELGAFRTEVNARLDRLEGLMFVIRRNFEVIDLRLKTLEAR